MIKWILTLLILSAGLSGVYYYHHQNGANQNGRTAQAVEVEVYEAKPLIINDKIEALGTAFANEAVNITANSTDNIIKINFEDGQKVSKGDILAVLDQAEEQAQKRAAIAQVEEHARELKRLEDLLKRNATAKTEYDERVTLLQIAKNRIDEIEARIADRTIVAPFDGILGLRKISVGSLVEPGSVITTIDDISQIKLDFTVPSAYLDVVKEGLSIHAKSNATNTVFKGKVTKVDSRVDPRTRSVEVRAILPNPEQELKPGLLLSVSLYRNEREAIVIPEDAIIQVQSNHYVYLVKNNKVTRQQIKIGQRLPGWVEVLDGLTSGNQIIVRGHLKVRPGSSVVTKQSDRISNFQEVSE